MFVKLAVLACVAGVALGNYGGWVSNSPHRNDPIPPGISPPAQFPAGVDPHSCPNYPHCGSSAPAPAWNGGQQGGWNGGQQGGWNGGQQGAWNGGHQGAWNPGQNALDSGAYTGDGDYHGEGLQEAGAFGDVSQNWNDNHGAWNGPQNGGWNGGAPQPNWNAAPHQGAAQLPAGVDAGACPNYPYCH